MIKNILVMFQSILNDRDAQALAELNDIFEEHELPRIEIPSNKVFSYSHKDAKIVENEYLILPNNSVVNKDLTVITNPEQLGNILGLPDFFENKVNENMDFDTRREFVERGNTWINLCKKILGTKTITQIRSPAEWGFSQNDMLDITNFVEFFTNLCSDPPELWFPAT